jgi:hypothetical protein
MEYDTFDIAARDQGTNDVAQLMDRHHGEPAQCYESSDEQELVKSLHSEAGQE